MGTRLLRRLRREIEDRVSGSGPVWRTVWAGPAALYARGSSWVVASRAREAVALPVPVISIGAIGVGGVGKTPCAAWLARWFQQRGLVVAVVANGRAADEERLHRRWIGATGIVLAGRRREIAARRAVHLGAEVVVLDDGFQYRRLHRQLDLVCVDPGDPLQGGAVVPAGPLREPAAALQRADVVWASLPVEGVGVDQAVVAQTLDRLRRAAPGATPVVVVGVPRSERPLPGGSRVLVCTGIARPERVHHTAEQLGWDVRGLMSLPDHADLGGRDTNRIAQRMRRCGAHHVIITDKDAARPGFCVMTQQLDAVVVGIQPRVIHGLSALEHRLERALRLPPPVGLVPAPPVGGTNPPS